MSPPTANGEAQMMATKGSHCAEAGSLSQSTTMRTIKNPNMVAANENNVIATYFEAGGCDAWGLSDGYGPMFPSK